MQRIDLTSAGKAALAKFHNGASTLRLSRMALGDGVASNGDVAAEARTALTHQVVSKAISKLKQDSNEITATITVVPSELSHNLYLREMGLYAVADGKELLFAYGTAGRFCAVISSDSADDVEVGATVSVRAADGLVPDNEQSLVTMGDFERAKNDLQREVNNVVESVNKAIADLPKSTYRVGGSEQANLSSDVRAYGASGKVLTQTRGLGDGSYALGALLDKLAAKSHTHGTVNVQSSGAGVCDCNCTIHDCQQCTRSVNCTNCANCQQCTECKNCVECGVSSYVKGLTWFKVANDCDCNNDC